jgi:outer membrane protein OmpA-like peptidoglycan-associated protein
MKQTVLLALGAAMVLVITSGCNSKPRITPLPNGSATSGDSRGDNVGSGLTAAPGTGVTGVAGVGVSDIPDADKLKDRDFDRAKFASETVLFDLDRAEVRASEATKVKRVADEFKKLSAGHDLLIEGHCDERGTEGYNQGLGERRALALRELLVQSGLDAQRVFTKSFGKDKPAVVGHDEAAWSKNRRGEFILVLPKKMTTTQNSQ